MIRLIFVSFLVLSNYTASVAGITCRKTVSKDSIPGPVILYVFTGSDWCTNCKRLEKKVMHDSAFLIAIASNNITIEYLDFPQRKKLSPETIRYNAGISERFGFNGTFPTLVLATKGSKKFRTIYYANEDAGLFSKIIINELKKLNE